MVQGPESSENNEVRRRFAQEVRALRDETGLTQEGVATRIGKSRQLIGLIERGTAAPTVKTARLLDTAFKTHGRFEGLLVTSDDLQHLLRRYTLLEQQRTKVLLQWQATVIPALLQTKAYARCVLEASIPALSPNAIQQRVQSRLDRQQALSRASPITAYFVLSESAVLQAVGGPQVMREQWKHLLKCMRFPNITVQVLPHRSGAHASMQGSYTILETTPATGWVVYVETAAGGEVLQERPLVDDVRQRFNALMVGALSGEESAQFIEHLT